MTTCTEAVYLGTALAPGMREKLILGGRRGLQYHSSGMTVSLCSIG